MKDTVSMPKGLVASAQSGGVAKGTPGGGGRTMMPKGDGLDKAWANQTAKPSAMTNMKAARQKVR